VKDADHIVVQAILPLRIDEGPAVFNGEDHMQVHLCVRIGHFFLGQDAFSAGAYHVDFTMV
jgi:hypothetical protein